jgi:hypothetical protein
MVVLGAQARYAGSRTYVGCYGQAPLFVVPNKQIARKTHPGSFTTGKLDVRFYR